MSALMSLPELQEGIEELASGALLVDPFATVLTAIELLSPPEEISSLECAEKYRLMPGNEDGAVVRYDRWRTPFNIGPSNALDDEACQLVVMVKPSRSGGTALCENYAFKRIKFGPMAHMAFILNSDDAVGDYCKNVVKPMFDLNDDIQSKVGTARGDDTAAYRKIRGSPVEWLSAKDSTFRNRQPVVMFCDETDGWTRKYQSSPRVQIKGRQKLLGNRKKAVILSHPDLGWKAGVAAEFENSSRGIFIMRCPHAECRGFAAAYATKFWPGVPQFELSWEKDPELPNDERLAMAERTAAIYCPHCGSAIKDDARRKMIDDAVKHGGNAIDGWMHRGQTLDPERGVIGEPDETAELGFWVHGTMLKSENMGAIAKDYQEALIRYARTRDPKLLKEFLSKTLGEVFEGAATVANLSPEKLAERIKDAEYDRGVVPLGVKFITGSVDTGRKKFDVMFTGWDLDGRSWIIDRLTIKQRRHSDGEWRNIDLSETALDWRVLIEHVVDRKFPLESDPTKFLPVACVTVDVGDGNVTWKAREFARWAHRQGHRWNDWTKFKLIKGIPGKRDAVPTAPRPVTKDEEGHKTAPTIWEYSLGVDSLKTQVLERLAILDGSPGQIHFYRGFERAYSDEFFGEAEIDGKWVRSGPNESLDLHGYAEAARQILGPDRNEIKWDTAKLPPWATPQSLKPKGGDQPTGAKEAAPKKPQSVFERHKQMNRKLKRDG